MSANVRLLAAFAALLAGCVAAVVVIDLLRGIFG
jgi:hypothetical protein